MEKGLDNASQACITQADIRSYFDSLPVLKILLWLSSRGVRKALLAAIVRAQILTQLVLTIGAYSKPIMNRSAGGLTGSLVALLLARVPVESTLFELRNDLSHFALDVGTGNLCAASYIDNLYTTGTGVSSSTAAMEMILAHLRDVWGLFAKPGSKEVLPCRGCSDMEPVGSDWAVRSSMKVLGWLIQNDAGTDEAWALSETKLWRAFWGNCRSPSFSKLSVLAKCKMVCRALGPIIGFAAQAWPPQHGLLEKINVLQRKMIAIAVRVPRYPDDDFVDFHRRRHREAAKLIEEVNGWWARKWWWRCVSWDEHCRRNLRTQTAREPATMTSFSWPPILLDWLGHDFLELRRLFHRRSATSHRSVSRTSTRVVVGHVNTRWHDGVLFAQSRIS